MTLARLYDARGNIYAVVSPQHLREQGVALPINPADAARDHQAWARAAIAAFCLWPAGTRPKTAKAHRCDGLLVGPFQASGPYELLIVNTDGSLAERSGNGLTIFSQALLDSGQTEPDASFSLRVHHNHGAPTHTEVQPATVDGASGFWLDIGKPTFGAQAAGATVLDALDEQSVAPLIALNARWSSSVWVRVGNPHCVTLLDDVAALPDMALLQAPDWHAALQRIAFAPPVGTGVPCAAGINLQWAARIAPGVIGARVFERGEGATASSGTSASAVACAAWHAGWVSAGDVQVQMPGGVAPLRLLEHAGVLQRVWLFGEAKVQ